MTQVSLNTAFPLICDRMYYFRHILQECHALFDTFPAIILHTLQTTLVQRYAHIALRLHSQYR